jgi:hypothetical protein
MSIRRRTGLIFVGVAALLLFTLIFVGPALIKVDRKGSVSVSGSDQLNYRGLAEITTKESFFINTVARLPGATLKDGKSQFPFRIGGTINNPVFSKGKGDKDVDAVQKPR